MLLKGKPNHLASVREQHSMAAVNGETMEWATQACQIDTATC